jgi:hypothetical protein
MFSLRLHPPRIVLLSTIFLVGACAEPECPHGFYKEDNACIRVDAGGISSSEAGASVSGSDAGADASTAMSPMDAAVATPGAGTPVGNDAGPPPASGTLGADGAAPNSTPPTVDAGASIEPSTPECDATHPCSAAFVCTAMKCVSACTQTRCDPNATCSLMSAAPVCTCNRGYIAMNGAGGAVSCLQDVACEQLGCDVNASCMVGTDQLRHCVCKNGYVGTGTTCTPVSCPTPTLANGTVSTPEGVTLGKTATYQCSTGFQQAGGSWSRACGPDMEWTGTAPSCTAITCPSLTSPANGTVSTAGGRDFGDTATYSCSQGYKIQSSAQRTCQEQGWSGTAPTCIATCGNGVLDSGEQCDPKAQGTSPWTCMPTTCELDNRTIYRLCQSSSDCDSGQSCVNKVCVIVGCSSSASCPAPPAGTGSTATCYAGAVSCVAACSTASNCPPGTTCNSVGLCVGCTDAVPCQNGQRCISGRCIF